MFIPSVEWTCDDPHETLLVRWVVNTERAGRKLTSHLGAALNATGSTVYGNCGSASVSISAQGGGKAYIWWEVESSTGPIIVYT